MRKERRHALRVVPRTPNDMQVGVKLQDEFTDVDYQKYLLFPIRPSGNYNTHSIVKHRDVCNGHESTNSPLSEDDFIYTEYTGDEEATSQSDI